MCLGAGTYFAFAILQYALRLRYSPSRHLCCVPTTREEPGSANGSDMIYAEAKRLLQL